jgi:hypothetical protein
MLSGWKAIANGRNDYITQRPFVPLGTYGFAAAWSINECLMVKCLRILRMLPSEFLPRHLAEGIFSSKAYVSGCRWSTFATSCEGMEIAAADRQHSPFLSRER